MILALISNWYCHGRVTYHTGPDSEAVNDADVELLVKVLFATIIATEEEVR